MAIRTHIAKQEEDQAENATQLRVLDPDTPVTNQLWINTTFGQLKFYSGSGIVLVGSRAENLSSDPVPGLPGRLIFNTTSHQLKFDDGSAITPIGGDRAVQGSFGTPVTLSSSGITALNARTQLVYVSGAAGAVDLSSINPQISDGYRDGDELTVYGASSINTVTLSKGNNVVMNGIITFGAHTVCTFIWNADAGVWTQKGWSNDI